MTAKDRELVSRLWELVQAKDNKIEIHSDDFRFFVVVYRGNTFETFTFPKSANFTESVLGVLKVVSA